MAFFAHWDSVAEERYEQPTPVPDCWDQAAWRSLAFSRRSHLLADYFILGVDPFPYIVSYHPHDHPVSRVLTLRC